MRVSFVSTRPNYSTDLALLVPKNGIAAAVAGHKAADSLQAAATLGRFDGDAGTLTEYISASGDGPARVLLAGIGAGTPEDFEKAGSALCARLLMSGAKTLVIDAAGAPAASAARLAAAVQMRGWRYDKYRTKLSDKQKPTLDEVIIVNAEPGLDTAWAAARAVVEGVSFTRELVTEPANIIYPESFVDRCQKLAEVGVQIEVLDEDAMRAAGMGALLGVSQGSRREARLLVMKWDGTAGTEATPVVFIGKGVTFDTGGISIKGAAGMEDMKWDMGGAGAVAGAMLALATRKAKAHVVGICGLVENMPDGNAQRPGDVVTSMSGQTIEVINTDAEGRLVLCDAMTWAQQRFSPKVMIDLATLTGAMIVALGHEYGGMFANDDGLAAQLSAAGASTGDPLWRLPMGDAYNKLIDSPIADMKNIGPREGGSITAAQFLKRFVDQGVKWAHLDIAGMVWSSKPGAVWDKGATGYGVRLLDRYIADNHERVG
ncbi:leucyl aminopeptidase [Sphingomonas sp.]|uniref:leucyl aminopeptidase n=1 Tax=Sphingomonas sp. TaxID=28214 RepID=UPI0025F9EFD7|nr:leucyl aminopeptidase [Sphingomonas sp.]